MNSYAGIDVSKATLDGMLIHADGREERFRVTNDRDGFRKLHHLLKKRVKGPLHIALEATGVYSEAVTEYLHALGYLISVVNPAQIKSYSDSQLRRFKTDAGDAALIAHFCRTQQPPAWQPLPPEVHQLQAMVRHLQALQAMRQQEANRLQAAQDAPAVVKAIGQHLAFLDQQIDDLLSRIRQHLDQHPDLRQQRDLLVSIPGIGLLTAARILSELPRWAHFTSPKQVAAFAGLAPQQRQSGTSLRGKTRLSKRGSGRLRHALYMPALVALRHNPTLAAFAQRLRANGLPQLAVIAAVMRKLLLLAFAILKSGRPFEPHFVALPS